MLKWFNNPATPFILPLIAYLVIQLGFSGAAENAKYVTFPIATLVCTLMVLYYLKRYPTILEFKLPFKTVGVGIVAAILWIVTYNEFIGPSDDGFNPGSVFDSPDLVIGSLIVRVFGSVITISLIEEICWRGWLQRYIINEKFEEEPVGKYTTDSFWGTVLAIILVHADVWMVALPWAVLSTWWFMKVKCLGSMVLLHAVTNFVLALYVIATGSWYFW